MNIVCVICSDLFVPSSDIFHTSCGHIFHYACLLQWLERSKTCPQCRERSTNKTIHRTYFNFSNNDSIVEDVTTLQQKNDNLTFQLKLKDETINNITGIKEKLEKQKIGLVKQIHEVESELNSKNSAISALKDQIKFYKQRCSDMEGCEKENKDLKENLTHLKNVQNLIDSSKPKLDNVIIQTTDASKLITYIGVLKGELDSMREKNKECRERYKNIMLKWTHVSKENQFLSQEYAKQENLEGQLMICESEKISLQSQLLDMQINARRCVCNEMSAEETQESLQAYEEHHTLEESNVIMNGDMATSNILKPKKDSCIIIDLDSTENSPENIKPQSFISMRDHSIKRQQSSSSLKVPPILAKKSRINQPNQKTASDSSMSFDGFGGHAKYDRFPHPVLRSHVKKLRDDTKINKTKTKLDTGNNQKIDLLLHNDVIM